MRLYGRWKSKSYVNISGTLDIYIPDNFKSMDIFDCNILLNYDKSSQFKPGGQINIACECKVKDDKELRIIMRQKEFSMSQYFTVMLIRLHPISQVWHGYLTCIFPYDICELFLEPEKKESNETDKIEDENIQINIDI
ncbi:hypothetical protein QKU48_gp0058 [Fadolivirus algeromassiliense]|jgi:hypothetical protein|uniref:Uncharacterized protein n=1 Tax=Fadolivirus FV1/VV64 TaxID=3070911 RepID=A0A7D3V792_9VIRU|nr:hypothetical protein QKU48_gp0058 [Fadolivirus algeromassiliense]QKF93516.1 hypothetical protein Fadolivirus_1_58 [Fadolivirus FV1/VV64]